MEIKDKIIQEYQQKNFVESFDKTRSEDIFHRKKHEFETKIIKNAINKIGTEQIKVLDVACGTGRILSEIIKDERVLYTGVDTSKAMLEQLNKKHNNLKLELVLSDASTMKFKDNTFDVSFTYHLLWHLPFEEQKKIILEMIRVTKEGGIIIFDTLNNNFLFEKMKKFTNIKLNSEMYRLNKFQVKDIINQKKFKIDKLLDPPIKNKIVFETVNALNKINGILPSSFFHMIFFSVKK